MEQKSILFQQSGVSAQLVTNEPFYVWADDFLIEEAFLNYLTNAIKYCSGEKRIEVSLEKIGDNVRVNVFNTGEGVEESVLENICKSFYMADKARTRDNGSQGLGLSIVSAIMNAHNREYGAYNTENGIVFYFELDGKSE
jgi:signal transduction histidine kinase